MVILPSDPDPHVIPPDIAKCKLQTNKRVFKDLHDNGRLDSCELSLGSKWSYLADLFVR